VDYVVNLTKLVGATPLFGDPAEIDSFITAADLMPKIVVAAFCANISSQASWREIQRITGHPFAHLIQVLEDENKSGSLAAALIANSENVVWRLDGMIQKLMEIKDLVRAADGESLQTIVDTADQAITESRITRFSLDVSDDDRDKAQSKALDVIGNFLWPSSRHKRSE
jgi:hypothetical protein